MMTSSKKSRGLDYYVNIFKKISESTILMQSLIAREQLVQNLWKGCLSPLQVI